ncbi:hypothetical protein C0068_04930 [Zhongshania marina]|uniref:Uncharacterized protein n=1 Tax=Zhongshania marina TaxID=2304603 RepID=A0A2S4HIY0_9GAMM|nr:hypothetical protein C0068_04930 [Marortus luteolus]
MALFFGKTMFKLLFLTGFLFVVLLRFSKKEESTLKFFPVFLCFFRLFIFFFSFFFIHYLHRN